MITYFILKKENGKILDAPTGKVFVELINLVQNDVLKSIVIAVRNQKICAVCVLGDKFTKETQETQETVIKELTSILKDDSLQEGNLKDLDAAILFKDDIALALEDKTDTPFRKQVWKEIAKIPYNETRTYSEIATAIGKPSAIRAVANACGTNPISILVPCHRVIPKNSTKKDKGGYRWGSETKCKILEYESKNC